MKHVRSRRQASRRPTPRRATGSGVLASLRETGPAVRWLLCCVFVNQLGAFVQVFLVLYLVHAGIDESHAGLALGTFGVGAVLGALMGGWLADRLGRRTTIVGAMLCAATMTMSLTVLATPETYVALLAALTLTGAATHASRPATAAMLADSVPPERLVMTVSMWRLALNSGAVLGPLAAAALLAVSWDLLFLADGLTTVTCAALAWRFLPSGRSDAAAPALAPGDDGESADAASSAAGAGGYHALLRDSRFLLYLFAMLAGAMIYMQHYAVLPLKIRADGHPELVYSAVLALAAGLVISCELLVTKHVQAWRPAVAATGGGVLIAVGLTAYGLPGGVWLLFAATSVGVLGQIVSGPTMFAHPQRVAPAGSTGRYSGAAHAMFGLGTALGPLLGVLMWNAVGNGIWALCGTVGLMAAGAAFLAVREPSAAAARPRVSPTPTAEATR